MYIGNLVGALSVSLAPPASPVIEIRHRIDARDDRLSSEVHLAMEGVKLLARVFGHLLSDLPPEDPSPDDFADPRRVLYGLHAILSLHFAQEEEAYAWLGSEADRPERTAAAS